MDSLWGNRRHEAGEGKYHIISLGGRLKTFHSLLLTPIKLGDSLAMIPM